MTPKEKAQELLQKFNLKPISPIFIMSDEHIKMCALIAVDEIISANPHSNPLNTDVYSTMKYWQEVKHEIEKL